jgi:hypothetical protein
MTLVYTIAWFISLIVGIWLMISKKKNISADQPSMEPLSGKEKLLIFILCVANPVILGAIFYYGWRKKLPQQAKTANWLSFGGFFVALVIYGATIYFTISKVGWQNTLNLASEKNQIQTLDQQAEQIAMSADPEDAADLQAMQANITIGSVKAATWQPDAKFYSYRRIFTLPSNVTDTLIGQADSYYFESKNTDDVYEPIFSRSSNEILRTDIDANRLQSYVNYFPDIAMMKVGPKKAMEIAMLNPAFITWQQTHPQISESDVVLNPGPYLSDLTGQPITNDLSGYWFVEIDSVWALVNAQTGDIITATTADFVQQLNSAEGKLQ